MNNKIEKVKGIRDSWKVSTIRALCIQQHWFYHGGEAQYSKMFELLKQNDFRAVATAIWLCSDTELNIAQIEERIITELYDVTADIESIIE